MKILILGGTGFLGPQLVEAMLARKHTPTLFNRGKTNPHLFPDIEQLHGDRKKDLSVLAGREWDAVIDTSGYVPEDVERSATALAKSVKLYVFISTVSVYADGNPSPITEESSVGKVPEGAAPDPRNPAMYGPLKALCEQTAERIMPGRVTNIRPGLIVGPGDPTDRFTYWPMRLYRGGEVLCPGPQDEFVQFIDARDLARWTIQMIEEGHVGVYNATGPRSPLTMAGLIHGCRACTSNDVKLTWVDADFCLEKQLGPWMEMPLWVPGESTFAQTSFAKAQAVGLTFKPLADTVRDTIDWAKTRPDDYKWTAGLAAEKEASILKAWHENKK